MNKTLIISIIILIIINLLTISYYSSKNNKLSTDNYNLTIQSDTVKKNYNQLSKQYEFSKKSYLIQREKDLMQFNNQLAKQAKQTKNTAVAINGTANIALPTQTANNSIQDTTGNQLNSKFTFQYSDSSLNQLIAGRNSIDLLHRKVITAIDTNQISVKLAFNVVNQSNKYIITAFSRSKYVNFSDLNSVLIINKLPVKQQNRLKIGAFFGWGLNTDARFDNLRTGYSCGVGLNYRLF